jgi:hypothetical protein
VFIVRPKIAELNFNLYARSVHPELFEICNSRQYQRDLYQLQINIMRDGHFIQFQHGGQLITEIQASATHILPSQANLISQGIEGSSTLEFQIGSLRYQTHLELEMVDPKLFVMIQQQLDARIECEGLVHRFGSNGRIAIGAISYINVQSFKSNALVRAIHTFPDSNSILKSETRFLIRQPESA